MQAQKATLMGAMEADKNGEMGCNRAALEYSDPHMTLKDCLSGRVVHGTITAFLTK